MLNRTHYISLLSLINSFAYFLFYIVCFAHCLVLILVLLFTRATVSAVSCLLVPVFICTTYLIVMCFEIK